MNLPKRTALLLLSVTAVSLLSYSDTFAQKKKKKEKGKDRTTAALGSGYVGEAYPDQQAAVYR